jgi:hypothetical protein
LGQNSRITHDSEWLTWASMMRLKGSRGFA